MEILDWESARELVRPVLGDAFADALFGSIDEWGGALLGKPLLAAYRYGDHVFHDGVLQPPELHDNDPERWNEYVHPQGLSLALIIENSCEVQARIRRPGGMDEHPRAPEALLGPGEWLGLFELFNAVKAAARIKPDWEIVAGVTCIHGLLNHGEARLAKKLKPIYGSAPDRAKVTFQLIDGVRRSPQFGGDWKFQILVFPPSVLDKIICTIQQRDERPLNAFQAKALFALLHSAWERREMADQDIRLDFYTALQRDAAGIRHDVLLAASALCSFAYRASMGTIPLYCACDSDDSGGPFSEIAGILEKVGLPKLVMRPKYRMNVPKHDQHGYYLLSDIHEYFGTQRQYDKLKDVAVAIRRCYTERKTPNNLVFANKDIFDSIVFRIHSSRIDKNVDPELISCQIDPAAKNVTSALRTVKDSLFFSDRIWKAIKDWKLTERALGDRDAESWFLRVRLPLFSNTVRIKRV